MEKGARVKVTTGRHEGVLGTVFWLGEGKRGPRLGMRDDRGETLWLDCCDVEESDAAAPSNELPPDAPIPEKGSRVRWTTSDDEVHTGTVFWFGDAKGGPGKRVGVREDGTGETVWRDAVHVEVLGDDEAPPPAAAGPVVEYNKGDDVEVISGPQKGAMGSVFWIGANKFGAGQRLGVKVDDESLWLDSAQVRALGGGHPSPAPAASPQPFDEPEEAPAYEPGEFDAAPPDMPDVPMWDEEPPGLEDQEG